MLTGAAVKGVGGKKGRSGRKTKAQELGLSALLNSTFGLEKRKAVIEHLAAIAVGDDPKAAVSAASLLLGYTYGKPTEKHEHSNADGSPLLSPIADALTKIYGATAVKS